MQNTGGSRPQGRHNEDGWYALSTWSFTKARHIFWLILWELSTWLLRNKQKLSLFSRQLLGKPKKYFQKIHACFCNYVYLPLFGEKSLNAHSFHHAATRQLCILAEERCAGIHRLRTNKVRVAHFKTWPFPWHPFISLCICIYKYNLSNYKCVYIYIYRKNYLW